MALPPTMIYQHIKGSPANIFSNLRKAGLLRKEVLEDYDNELKVFSKRLKEIEKEYFSDTSGMTGPNLTDLTAEALSGYLNKFGNELAFMPEYDPKKITKVKLGFKQMLYRLRSLLRL